MEAMKNIVYLSSDYGEGHKSAVRALVEAIDKYYPGQYAQEPIDIIALFSPTLDKLIERLYKDSVRYFKPTYKAFFEMTNTDMAIDFDKNIYPIIKRNLKPILKTKPDIIISCYPAMAYSVSRYLGEKGLDIPHITLITDTGPVHEGWISRKVDYFLVPTEKTAAQFIEKGISPEKIKCFGFPVKQNFYQKYNKKLEKEKFLVAKSKHSIVYFPGAWSAGRTEKKLKALDVLLKNVSILVVCGNNVKLRSKLLKNDYQNNVEILGFVEDVAEIFAAADLVITKAGGISIMEIITVKIPFIITEVTPGQEEPNARFIEEMGFGYVEKEPEGLAKRTKELFSGDNLKKLEKNLDNYHENEHSDKKIAEFINLLVN